MCVGNTLHCSEGRAKDANHKHRRLKANQCTARVSQLKAWPPPLLHKSLMRHTSKNKHYSATEIHNLKQLRLHHPVELLLICKVFLPQKAVVANRLLSRGGAHLAQMPWQAG